MLQAQFVSVAIDEMPLIFALVFKGTLVVVSLSELKVARHYFHLH